ncbi:MAG: DUF4389 domain-containing protein [Thermoleophilia bacterium]|nr:DUF4389 domain-containing protein [Thermoleophilia bacterium]
MDAAPLSPQPAPTARRPTRLVVADDLRRSRLTVFFRLLLALPHIVWLVLWSLAAWTVAFPAWLVALFDGRLPRVFHDFLAAYVRYTVHVTAYLTLAANRFPGFRGRPGYDVDVEIDPPAQQGRWSVAFRLLLAIPATLLAGALVTGGSAGSNGSLAVTVALLAWFAALVTGRMPRGFRDLLAYSIGYLGQTGAYLLLLTDRYPTADPAVVGPAGELPTHAVRLELADPLARSRLTVFFRLLLALPHIFWLLLWSLLVLVLLPFAWVIALVIGRLPRPLQRLFSAWVRYAAHVTAFLYLVGGPFPGFSGAAYPVSIVVEPATRQRRLGILVRGVLAVPAMLVSGAYGSVMLVVAFLGWFAALVTGRMPEGLRNIGAVAIRYSAQTSAYLTLVTDRYPYAAPTVPTPAADEAAA